MISNVCIHATASCLAGTAAESRAGGVDKLMITVLATFPADDYSRPVRTPAINHVILALPALPVIGPVRYVADIADAPRRVAIRVPLAQSNVDGIVATAAIAAICRVRSHVISFLAIVAARRSW
jgi:hypothetical protein